jgi:alpha-amylase/alpha-mannosidase (GH57 family)
MERYVCVHGHFYQPPRENPWLEFVELQDSAYPYHDWNQRIAAECYAPNAASRILDEDDRIVRIVNNYSRMSFNFGPTLLSWLEENEPFVYRAVLDADRESRSRFSGHGNAIAQVYNHMILPLANRRDKETQIVWGIRDFERRFQRPPEGMWLAETAVDLESLDLLAAHGVRFTILAPSQAGHVREPDGPWRTVRDDGIDPKSAYLQRLPSGRSIALFFYDGPVSRSVAFEGLLRNGEQFASRLAGAFASGTDGPQIVHIATDGETYGHHHRHGDMALAYALDKLDAESGVQLSNYAEFLERHPPAREVRILENTSWSCAHGIERWRSDCGCSSGSHPGWRQAWRGPLRAALDRLRDRLAHFYERSAPALLKDPWRAREDYIGVVLDRSPENIARFFGEHGAHTLSATERVEALKLLEIQRHAMLMYTSCGWFFDELSGIETVQVIQYAGRAVQLAQELFGDSLEETFLADLENAPSNLPGIGDGRRVYERFVRPAVIDLEKMAAHYAVSSLFERYPDRARIYSHTVERRDARVFEAGLTKLVVGQALFSSEITGESQEMSYGILHFGDHNVNCGVREFQGDESYQTMMAQGRELFERADFAEIIRLFDRHFGEATYSLKSLFRDEQRKIVTAILKPTLAEADAAFGQVYDRHAPLMRFLADLGVRLPGVFRMTAEFVLNRNLRRAFKYEIFELERIQGLLETARLEKIALNTTSLSFTLEHTLESLMEEFRQRPSDVELLRRIGPVFAMAQRLPFEVTLWKPQNVFYELSSRVFPEFRSRADPEAREWVSLFQVLGESLSVRS